LTGAQAVSDALAQQIVKVICVVIRALIKNGLIDGHGPVTANAEAITRPNSEMGRWESLNVGERRGCRVLIETKQKEIGNREIVELVRDKGMLADAIKRIAEN
jgi:hypothetical protein